MENCGRRGHLVYATLHARCAAKFLDTLAKSA